MMDHTGILKSSAQRLMTPLFLTFAAITSLPRCSEAFRHSSAGVTADLQEPENADDYVLYTPSNYDHDHQYPLIVACAGGFFDSPQREIGEWSTLAESEGFIVAAPKLRGSSSMLSRSGDRVYALTANECEILSVVRHVRGSHNISEDRIFLFGTGKGVNAAIYTGLHNPRVFRAIAIVQPRFDEAGLGILHGQVDPNQPVYLCYGGGTDKFTKENGRRVDEWLHHHGADVRKETIRLGSQTDPQRCIAFYRTVLGNIPWIQIKVIAPDPAEPLRVQFSVESRAKPAQLLWNFGDSDESQVAEPVHTFAKAGNYVVTVTLDPTKKDAASRAVSVTVPGPIVQPAPVPERHHH